VGHPLASRQSSGKGRHEPEWQTSPGLQVFPHLPQCSMLTAVSTQEAAHFVSVPAQSEPGEPPPVPPPVPPAPPPVPPMSVHRPIRQTWFARHDTQARPPLPHAR
jgi:hypothetical protein